MNLHTTTLRHRLGPGAAAGLVLASSLALSACGSSSSSTSSPSTSTSVSSASVSSASPASAPASSATSAASPASSGSAATPSASGTQHTAAQLSQALAATRLQGVALVPDTPTVLAKDMKSFVGERAKLARDAHFTPAECHDPFFDAFIGMDGMTTSNSAISQVGAKQPVAVLVTDSSTAQQKAFDADAVRRCATYTEKDPGSAKTVRGTMKEVALTSRQTTEAHEVDLSLDADLMRMAKGRVGGTTIQLVTEQKGVDLGADLDAVAAQVKKLG